VSHIAGDYNQGDAAYGCSYFVMTAEVDRVKLSVDGADTWDAGTAQLLYES